jgi:hypothetical protein
LIAWRGIHLPFKDVAASVAELERVGGMGLRPALLPDGIFERPYYLEEWEPLREAADSLQLPITMHDGGLRSPLVGPGLMAYPGRQDIGWYVLALVHRSCPATSQIFGATGGYYCRYAISHTEGATFGPHPSVEDIAGNWELIRDGSLPNELDGEAMAWGVKAHSGRLQGLAAQLRDAESTNV